MFVIESIIIISLILILIILSFPNLMKYIMLSGMAKKNILIIRYDDETYIRDEVELPEWIMKGVEQIKTMPLYYTKRSKWDNIKSYLELMLYYDTDKIKNLKWIIVYKMNDTIYSNINPSTAYIQTKYSMRPAYTGETNPLITLWIKLITHISESKEREV